jgi:hypothetical protein
MKVGKIIAGLLMASFAVCAQPFGIGIKGGIPLTDGLSNFNQLENQVTTHSYSDSKQYIVGPMVEVRLPLSLAIEADALYRPINFSMTQQQGSGPLIRSAENVSNWEFPILGKFRLPLPVVKPYVEAGPSFRKTGEALKEFANRGATIGAGVEIKIVKLRIGPEVRYTRWAGDGQPAPGIFFPPSKQDQAEFLVGISF